MNRPFRSVRMGALAVVMLAAWATAAPPQIPDALRAWEDWATWDVRHRDCPTPYHSPDQHLCFWPSTLALRADASAGAWDLEVTAYEDTWVPLPGSAEMWPQSVQADGVDVVVVERAKHPAVRLARGTHHLTGTFAWERMPQQLRIPGAVGLLTLVRDGAPVAIPNWDAKGTLWLKRQRVEATDADQVAVQVYRLIEDGIPLWLRTDIELTVSGKSREEDLGWVLPEGWKPARVESPIPVAVDEQGRMKAQVRAGKWVIQLQAFRTTDPGEIAYAASATPILDRDLVAFGARPSFRVAEVDGLQPVDVTQTTFPEKWRNYPVFTWPTDTGFRLVEKMRGMGLQHPEGLRISRELWLDNDGRSATFRDGIQGNLQQIWRLDIAAGQSLGAVRVDGTGQLITTNPATGAHGVEVRTRQLNLQAIGRMDRLGDVPATGWATDVDALSMKIHLPPGWRVFALFGADWVRGDWLTAWSLLDLFLLLIFSMAVVRLWGWKAGAIAFFAFGLAYHEPGAPRFSWLFLLMPLALLRVNLGQGAGPTLVGAWRFLAVALLVLFLVPFLAGQLQSVMYPQLEHTGQTYRKSGARGIAGIFRPMAGGLGGVDRPQAVSFALQEAAPASMAKRAAGRVQTRFLASNLAYDPKARIQTGPAEPEWTWNWVDCGWNGPVSAEQRIRPVLIPLTLHRGLTLIRVALLVVLAGTLLRTRRKVRPPAAGATAVLLVGILLGGAPGSVQAAELPDAAMLQTLRERLLEPSDAYPHGASIPEVSLAIDENRLTMDAEIHCAVRGAVPLPGRLPAWSPVSVDVGGETAPVIRRQDGYLWVLLDEGVHRVRVEGMLPSATEWAWTFQLKPKRVAIDAPGWTVTGVRPNGIPEPQVFFARQLERTEEEAAYDRKDFNVIVAVDRHLEVGLIWQVRTVVSRLSSPGKAVSLRVPLLAGEKVLTANQVVEDGSIEVQLGAGAESFSWESELPVGEGIRLAAADTDRWIERWHLVLSPVWNVDLSGLAPVFESGEENLVPVWHPWPNEQVTLTFRKPEAVAGETLTARRVWHETTLGRRQRTGQLKVNVECSIGEDVHITLAPDVEVSAVRQDGTALPMRRSENVLIVPVQPGTHVVEVDWRTDASMAVGVRADAVSLPVEAANITSVIRVPDSRWVLWTWGPLRGPAVRFWTVLAVALVAALVLGRLRMSPIGRGSWMLLVLGLTQVDLVPALLVVGWFFLVAWRGKPERESMRWWRFNLLQLLVVLASAVALLVLVAAVGEGLLGNPEMFIRGNGSSRRVLQWFLPRAGAALPQPGVLSVSVWFYRLLMLAWALWLATAVLGWLKWAWTQFTAGGGWRRRPKRKPSPPAIPAA